MAAAELDMINPRTVSAVAGRSFEVALRDRIDAASGGRSAAALASGARERAVAAL